MYGTLGLPIIGLVLSTKFFRAEAGGGDKHFALAMLPPLSVLWYSS